MPSIASSPRDTAILAVFAVELASSPQGALIQLEIDIIAAAAAGAFELAGATLTPIEVLVMQALGYTCKPVGNTVTVGWLRATR